MSKASRPHDEAVIELLREELEALPMNTWPPVSKQLMSRAAEALLSALRQGRSPRHGDGCRTCRNSTRRAIPRLIAQGGNPTLKTLLAILGAAGLRLSVTRRNSTPHPA